MIITRTREKGAKTDESNLGVTVYAFKSVRAVSRCLLFFPARPANASTFYVRHCILLQKAIRVSRNNFVHKVSQNFRHFQ